MTRIEEIVGQLDQSGGPDACWEWTGYREPRHGYGRASFGNYPCSVHRLVAEHVNGEDVAGRIVRHTCNNPPCANPRHLLVGTQAENIHDREVAGNNFKAKIGPEEVREIRALSEAGATREELAARFGLDASSVSRIARGKTWRWVK